ncbi:site-specific integrase [Paenibacillus sp. MABNS29]|uniref:site-specific integrase n=1 Tax=Paenibacillus sp. MABNS29 TaxID=3142627 RepID=UPI003D2DED24
MLAFSGIRSGELCALKDTDFNFELNKLRITKTLYNPDNNMRKYTLTPPKSTGSIRKFNIIDNVMNLLQSHIVKQQALRLEYKKLFDDYHENNFVFAHKNGYPLIQKNILIRMERILKKTSITKKATPHIFRHTHISMLTEAEVDLKTIMKRVGHDDAKTTLKVYTHVTEKMKKNANEKIKNHFSDILQI